MNRNLVWVNLAGVALLASLCVFQWRENRRLNLGAVQTDRALSGREDALAERELTLRDAQAELGRFRDQLSEATVLARQTGERLRSLEEERRLWIRERDQLLASATNWTRAVEARDARLAEVGLQLKKVAEERDQAIRKFNDLAEKYGRLVAELNAARVK